MCIYFLGADADPNSTRRMECTLYLTNLLTVFIFFILILAHTGPDVELIQEILSQVGKRHKDFGVQPSYFPHMGEALVYSIEQLNGPGSFTENHKAAWKDVYEELSAEIVKAM